MMAPLNPTIQQRLKAGARWSGLHDADLDGLVTVRMDWMRLPLVQVLLEAPQVKLSAVNRRRLTGLLAEVERGAFGAEQDLRALLMAVA